MEQRKTKEYTKTIIDKYGYSRVYETYKQLDTFRKIYNTLCRKCQHLVFKSVTEGKEDILSDLDKYCIVCKKNINRFIEND